MCEQCSAEVDEYGHPLEGWMLCQASRDGNQMKKGEWGLVQCNDPTYVWGTKPTEDPSSGKSDAELEQKDKAFWDEDDKWIEDARKFGEAIYGTPREGHTLYEAGLKAGYTRDKGGFEYWLYDHLARWLKANPEPTHRNRFPKSLDIGDKENA